MFPNGFNTDGLFTIPKVEKDNDLDRFCKQEGMNYSQVVLEVKNRTRQRKGWYIRLFRG